MVGGVIGTEEVGRRDRRLAERVVDDLPASGVAGGDEGPGRVRAAYGENYSRLAVLKGNYDPDDLFRANQNIDPASRVES
jgi:Berberine and berberine like